MTNEEALKVINRNIVVAIQDWDDPTDEYQREQAEGLQKAKEALEKQIPKKPNATRHYTCIVYRCPVCGKLLTTYYPGMNLFTGDRTKFCDDCSQKIDWS